MDKLCEFATIQSLNMKQNKAYLEETVEFHNGSMSLSGTFCLPQGAGPFPVVVYVMGSGPAGRDGYGTLPPLWEEFARHGVAALAWDKPGVGKSTGDWKTQSNEDRANESVAAIQFLKEHRAADAKKIGLWGISQAGWVLPIIYSLAPKDIAFIIAVSVPVGTGAEQELYRVSKGLPADGFSEADTKKAVAFTRNRLELMKKGVPYQVVAEMQEKVAKEPWFPPLGNLNKEAYAFLQRNAFFSPLPLIKEIACPVLAIFGSKDTIVDVQASAGVYAQSLKRAGNRDVTVKIFPDADHVIFPSRTGGAKELDESFSRPVKVFAPQYLETMGEWVGKRFINGVNVK